jgi:uncharacterized membrane protein YeaQ/YmgE (transglycosylase-associated protein family)
LRTIVRPEQRGSDVVGQPKYSRSRLFRSGLGYQSCDCCPYRPAHLEEEMTITGILSAILIGVVVGVLGRLLMPGKQRIGILLTVLVGIGAAFLGTALARAMGIPTATSGVDWLELLVQVVVAAIGVGLVSAVFGKRRTGLLRR